MVDNRTSFQVHQIQKVSNENSLRPNDTTESNVGKDGGRRPEFVLMLGAVGDEGGMGAGVADNAAPNLAAGATEVVPRLGVF